MNQPQGLIEGTTGVKGPMHVLSKESLLLATMLPGEEETLYRL